MKDLIMKTYCTIYIITNNFDNKVYVGQTWKSIIHRFKKHVNGKSRSKIHNAIKCHGKENFQINYLKLCETQEEADYWENWYINYYNAIELGYNLKEGGSYGRWSQELKDKVKNLENSGRFKKGKLPSEAGFKFGQIPHNRKLNAEQIYQILKLYVEEDFSSNDLSKMYNISKPTILKLLNNESYLEIANPFYHQFSKAIKIKLNAGSKVLTIELADEIRNLYLDGYGGSSKLAKKYKIDKSVVLDVLHNMTYCGNLPEDKLNLIKEKISETLKSKNMVDTNRKLDENKADEIRNLYLSNKTISAFKLADKYKVSKPVILGILKNIKYKTQLGLDLLDEIKIELTKAKGNKR
jgi:group I intron endonuclease